MEERDFLIKPYFTDQFDVDVIENGDKTNYTIFLTKEAWKRKLFVEFTVKDWSKTIISIIAPHKKGDTPRYYSIYARNDLTSELWLLTKKIGEISCTIIGYENVDRAIEEAKKLIKPILLGDLKKSKEYQDLLDQF